jgi:hypothetical protein
VRVVHTPARGATTGGISPAVGLPDASLLLLHTPQLEVPLRGAPHPLSVYLTPPFCFFTTPSSRCHDGGHLTRCRSTSHLHSSFCRRRRRRCRPRRRRRTRGVRRHARGWRRATGTTSASACRPCYAYKSTARTYEELARRPCSRSRRAITELLGGADGVLTQTYTQNGPRRRCHLLRRRVGDGGTAMEHVP